MANHSPRSHFRSDILQCPFNLLSHLHWTKIIQELCRENFTIKYSSTRIYESAPMSLSSSKAVSREKREKLQCSWPFYFVCVTTTTSRCKLQMCKWCQYGKFVRCFSVSVVFLSFKGKDIRCLQYPLQIMFWRTSALKQNYEVAKHQDLASHKRLVIFASCIRDAPLTAMSVSSSANSNYHCRFVIWRQDAHHFAKDGF